VPRPLYGFGAQSFSYKNRDIVQYSQKNRQRIGEILHTMPAPAWQSFVLYDPTGYFYPQSEFGFISSNTSAEECNDLGPSQPIGGFQDEGGISPQALQQLNGEISSLTIVDLAGRVLYQTKDLFILSDFASSPNQMLSSLSIETVGMYFIEIRTDANERLTFKLSN
jgi:hypothetical protein